MTFDLENLRSRICPRYAYMSNTESYERRQCVEEIDRLRAALKYQEDREGHQGTHGPDCYKWGPRHYECALQKIKELEK